MKDKLSDKIINISKGDTTNKTIWYIVTGVMLAALVLIACIVAGGDHTAGRILPPSASPSTFPSPFLSPTPGATSLLEGYRLPLVPIFETPRETTPPTPAASPMTSSPPMLEETNPIEGVFNEEERTFLAAGFLQGEPVALFVIRQQGDKLTALSLCPKAQEGMEESAEGVSIEENIALLKEQVKEEAGVELKEYVYVDFAALPALSKAAGEEEAYVAEGQEALKLEGGERARAMLLLGAELFDALKDITPLNALLLQGTIQGQWGSSLKLSRLWALGSAMKKCSERVLVLVPEGGSEEQKNILKKFFTTG